MTTDEVLAGLRPTGAVERTATPLDRQIRWALGIIDDHGMERAAVLIVPDAGEYEAIRASLAKGGVKRVRGDQWARCDLDPANLVVVIRDGHVPEITAEYRENLPGRMFRDRRSRLAANPPQPVSARWMDAALARHPIVALLPFSAFGIEDENWERLDLAAPVEGDGVLDAAGKAAAGDRMLWACLARADLGEEEV